MADILVGSCRVEACGAAVEGEPTAVRSWLVWHVYDDHRDWWLDALHLTGQEVRPPYDERPDLSLIMPWPPVGKAPAPPYPDGFDPDLATYGSCARCGGARHTEKFNVGLTIHVRLVCKVCGLEA